MRLRRILPLLLVLLPAMVVAAPVTLRDDFSGHPNGSLPTGWTAETLGWETRPGALEFDGAGTGHAWPGKAPMGRRVVVEATLEPRKSLGTEWKTSGVVIRADANNYWHLAFVETPNSQGRRHHFELTEMYEGRWLAQNEGDSRLEVGEMLGYEAGWEYGKRYRFRLECTPGLVTGTVTGPGGQVATRRSYRLADRSVRTGRPALVGNSMACSFAGFQAEVDEVVPDPAPRVFPPYDLKPMSPIVGKKTGFFHPEKIGGRWWFIDPSGHAFYAVGTDHVNCYAHSCEKLGYAPYSRNVFAKFGTEPRWADDAADRLRRWGFNTLGAGCVESVRYKGLTYVEFLAFGTLFSSVSDIAPRTTWTGFPNAFDPRWERWCELQASRSCAIRKDDPWMLGYFLDNELEWFGKNGAEGGLVDCTWEKPADHSAKRALVAFLRARYATIQAFNSAWGVKVGSFDDLAARTTPLATTTPRGNADRIAFVQLIADRYFGIMCRAIRRADPNHAILGCRFAMFAPPVWEIAGKYLDVVSVNYYGNVNLEGGYSADMPAKLAEYHRKSGRPLMITEWSFPALDAGLPSRNGAGQRVPTQRDKARAYSIYQRHLFSMPFMVGSDYFMWVDEPALGISSTFPEDSNYGLVDEKDRAWPELTAVASVVNRMAAAIHSGTGPELSVSISEKPRTAIVRVANSGKSAANAELRTCVQGKVVSRLLRVAAGASVSIAMPVGGLAYVTAEVSGEDVAEGNLRDNRAALVVGRASARGGVVVVNPTAQVLAEAPVEVRLAAAAPVRVAGIGRCQVEQRPDGAWLAFTVPLLPAYSARAYRLQPGGPPVVKGVDRTRRPLHVEGELTLDRVLGDGPAIGKVALGAMELGSYNIVVNQDNGQPLWVGADRLVKAIAWQGPARTVLLLTVAGGRSAPITAAGPDGTYAARGASALAYEATVRLVHWPRLPAFDATLVELRNIAARPCKVVSYYHYPISSIGGSLAGDEGGGTGAMPRWHDADAGYSYGAFIDPARLQSTFWRDKGPNGGEHADIWRKCEQVIQPGKAALLLREGDDTIVPPADEPTVRMFGARGDAAAPGCAAVERLQALSRVTAALVK